MNDEATRRRGKPDFVRRVLSDLRYPRADVASAGSLNRQNLILPNGQQVDEPKQVLPDMGEWVPPLCYGDERPALFRQQSFGSLGGTHSFGFQCIGL